MKTDNTKTIGVGISCVYTQPSGEKILLTRVSTRILNQSDAAHFNGEVPFIVVYSQSPFVRVADVLWLKPDDQVIVVGCDVYHGDDFVMRTD